MTIEFSTCSFATWASSCAFVGSREPIMTVWPNLAYIFASREPILPVPPKKESFCRCGCMFFFLPILLSVSGQDSSFRSPPSGCNSKNMESNIASFCHMLPKVELHCHLGGTARHPSLVKQLLAKGHKTANDLASRCFISGIDTKRTPSEQNEMFEIVSSAFSSASEKKQLVLEYIEQCVEDNVVYCELRTGLSDRAKCESVYQAVEECKQKGIQTICRLISSIHRDWSFDRAEQAMKLALEYREKGVVAMDLCGDPLKGSFKQFAPLFEFASREGVPWTCHFAESQNESDLVEILNAKPSRLGHCCFISMKPPIEQRIQQERIPIECCLSSNINTMRLHGGVREHPVARNWIAQKHPFVLCTDNPGILCTTMSKEYTMLAKALNLSKQEILQLAKDAVKFSFADEATKQSLSSKLSSWAKQQQEEQAEIKS